MHGLVVRLCVPRLASYADNVSIPACYHLAVHFSFGMIYLCGAFWNSTPDTGTDSKVKCRPF